MATFDYASLQVDAAAILTELGQPLTLEKRGEATFNTATQKAVVTTTNYSVVGILNTIRRKGLQQFLNNTDVRVDDKIATISASDVNGVLIPYPAAGDTLIDNGVPYRILAVLPTDPGGVAVAFELHVRR